MAGLTKADLEIKVQKLAIVILRLQDNLDAHHEGEDGSECVWCEWKPAPMGLTHEEIAVACEGIARIQQELAKDIAVAYHL